MADSTALDSFLDKWRSRWPEWRVVEVFVPAPQRQRAVAWFALLQEFVDAMNIQGDPLPADAKLAWWGEELRDWSRHRSRHPLGRVLEPHPAPWFELAEALPALIALREPPRDVESAFRQCAPLATAIAAVDAALFGQVSTENSVVGQNVQLLAMRLMGVGASSSAPLEIPGEKDWSATLLARWPATEPGSRPGKLWSALVRSRMQRFSDPATGVAPLSPARALWLGWRAAR